MKKVIKALAYAAVAALLFYLGWGWGKTAEFSRGYNSAIEQVKIDFREAVREEVPFWFGDVRFVPRKDGMVNAAIDKELSSAGRRRAWQK